jgi:hypothetical protein
MMVMMTAITPSEKASRRPGERGLDMGSAGKDITTQRFATPLMTMGLS